MLLRRVKRMIYIVLIIIVVLGGGVFWYMNLPKFGRSPRGARLVRIENSPNYKDGSFKNLEETPQLTSDKNKFSVMLDFLFEKRENTRPDLPMNVVKTDLKSLNSAEDLLVWFGHSSYYIQSGGLKFLIDPVFEDASPVSFVNRPFQGTDVFHADDMPNIDYLIITHDHWDHLDYETVVKLRGRVGKVVCPLGVGEHFEYWGFNTAQIIEMDWDEKAEIDDDATIFCLPARHFSGRTLNGNKTLWASYVLQTNSDTIFLSGDGGYGKHIAQIAEKFPNLDLAILENGQYNENWKYIHMLPEDVFKTVQELKPRSFMTGHNSKYALAKHPWNEPMEKIALYAKQNSLPLLKPTIGEVVLLKKETSN